MEPEHERLRVDRLDGVDWIPVPELPVRERLEAEVVERREHGARIARLARMKARVGPQSERDLEPVVRDQPVLGEQGSRLPVRALRHERLVDGDARRVDVIASGIEPENG